MSQAFALYLQQVYYRYLFDLKRYAEAVVDEPEDPENLHKFRTTLRRLRSILKAFRRYIDPEYFQNVRKIFKNLMDLTNEVRDLDVFLNEIPSYVRSLPPSMRPWLDPLVEELLLRRHNGYKEIRRLLLSETFRVWFCDAISLKLRPTASISAKRAIQRAIKKAKKRLRKISPQDLHQKRIAYKQLRYLMELLAPFTDVKNSLRRLKKIQDLLGHYNDLVVQRQNIMRFVNEVEFDTKTILAAGKLMGDLEQEALKLRDKIKRKDIL